MRVERIPGRRIDAAVCPALTIWKSWIRWMALPPPGERENSTLDAAAVLSLL
jgi:hypothetical protein